MERIGLINTVTMFMSFPFIVQYYKVILVVIDKFTNSHGNQTCPKSCQTLKNLFITHYLIVPDLWQAFNKIH